MNLRKPVFLLHDRMPDRSYFKEKGFTPACVWKQLICGGVSVSWQPLSRGSWGADPALQFLLQQHCLCHLGPMNRKFHGLHKHQQKWVFRHGSQWGTFHVQTTAVDCIFIMALLQSNSHLSSPASWSVQHHGSLWSFLSIPTAGFQKLHTY